MAGWDLDTLIKEQPKAGAPAVAEVMPPEGKEMVIPPGLVPAPGTQARVIILLPHRDERDYRRWHRTFAAMAKPEGTSFWESSGMDCVPTRTDLVQKVLGSPENKEVTHLFWLDDDVVPPLDVIPKLLEANLPFVSGIYLAKKPLGQRGLAAWMAAPNKPGNYVPIDLVQSQRYAMCDVVGFGCAMVSRMVFERMSKPWFLWEAPPGISEDFYFCEKMYKELHVKPVLDMECKCGHIGTFIVDVEGRFDTAKI